MNIRSKLWAYLGLGVVLCHGQPLLAQKNPRTVLAPYLSCAKAFYAETARPEEAMQLKASLDAVMDAESKRPRRSGESDGAPILVGPFMVFGLVFESATLMMHSPNVLVALRSEKLSFESVKSHLTRRGFLFEYSADDSANQAYVQYTNTNAKLFPGMLHIASGVLGISYPRNTYEGTGVTLVCSFEAPTKRR
jgi:hypothetical protein